MPGIATTSPYVVDVKNLLEDARYDVEDHHLTTRPVVDASNAHGVETTPLLFIEDEPIGGYEDLRRWLARNAH